eukprot:Em0001g792a
MLTSAGSGYDVFHGVVRTFNRSEGTVDGNLYVAADVVSNGYRSARSRLGKGATQSLTRSELLGNNEGISTIRLEGFGDSHMGAVNFILTISFSRTKPLRSTANNLFSATLHPEPVAEYLANELKLNRMLGPFNDDIEEFQSVHVNRFGVIPKEHGTGKWRLITDLSYPPGSSVNDGIDPSLCSLRYNLGRGRGAYQLIPVHPDNRWLLGTKCEPFVQYMDPMHPFGLHSSAKIFNAVADALEWRLKAVGVTYVYHYLDDFTVLGAPGTDEFSRAVSKLHIIYSKLGIPLATHKSDSLVPRPRFPTAAGGLHHRYVESARSGDVIHPQLLGIWVWGRDYKSEGALPSSV